MSAVHGLRRAPGSASASRLPHSSQRGQRFTSQVLWVPSCRGDAAGKPKSSSETQPRSVGAPPGWTVGEGPCRAGRGDPPRPAGLTRARTRATQSSVRCHPAREAGLAPSSGPSGASWAFPSPSPLPVVSKTREGAAGGASAGKQTGATVHALTHRHPSTCPGDGPAGPCPHPRVGACRAGARCWGFPQSAAWVHPHSAVPLRCPSGRSLPGLSGNLLPGFCTS